MVKTLNITLEDEEYKQLRSLKQQRGDTWRELLKSCTSFDSTGPTIAYLRGEDTETQRAELQEAYDPDIVYDDGDQPANGALGFECLVTDVREANVSRVVATDARRFGKSHERVLVFYTICNNNGTIVHLLGDNRLR